MEEENQVLGRDAEAIENDINLESEDFCFYNQNKEEAKKNLDNSAKEWTDYVDSLIKDVPDLSEEKINAGIEKILARAYPDEVQPRTEKTDKKKRVTLRVLFVAAVVSLVSICGLFAVGNSKNISIENGFMAFAKETVQVVFFGDEKEEFISVDALLTNLEEHGYEDILFPEVFVNESDDYKVSVPVYLEDELRQVAFDIYSGETIYKFGIHSYDQSQQTFDYMAMDNVYNIMVENTDIYVFNFYNDDSSAEFVSGDYRYSISADIPYFEIISIIETIK